MAKVCHNCGNGDDGYREGLLYQVIVSYQEEGEYDRVFKGFVVADNIRDAVDKSYIVLEKFLYENNIMLDDVVSVTVSPYMISTKVVY